MGIPGGASQTQARLGRYELLARLATGGMGEIFLAKLEGAEGFEKLYVVKRILAHLADDARFRQMLVAEARIASKMSHPNICQVFELGETEGQLYIVMEYLEGVSMLPLLRRSSRENTALDLGFVAGVIQQVTEAMNYAHDLKDRDGEILHIIHRDVTPSNIFLTDTGVAKVLDFGIAKARGASTQTQEGTVKGKYAYMAPEQLKGGSIDHRVDIFALGIVLYEMLALRRLFQRKTDYLTFRAVMEQPIPDIRKYRSDLPDGVANALLRALDRDPDARFDSARQLGVALLDGFAAAGIRPWTQGEIGDFVRSHFADEIGKRSAQVAHVVHRTKSGHNARSTMPLLVHAEDDHEADDDDEGFPSVETEVEGAPPWRPTPQPMRAVNPDAASDFAATSTQGTPQPFGIESTGSAPALQPLPRGSSVMPVVGPNGQIVVVGQRSIFWPLFGVAMVLIAGGALFLVWQQMQKPQTPAEIKITQEPSTRPTEESNAAGSHVATREPADPPPPHADKPAITPPPPSPSPPKGKRVPPACQGPTPVSSCYRDAIQTNKAALVSCLNAHREQIPQGEIDAQIRVAPNGRAKQVTLTPALLNDGELGACLKSAIMAIPFPTSKEDVPFTQSLKPKQS